MSLTESPSLSKTATPIKSTVLPSDAYVLSLASLPSHYAASSSASANNIYLFDKFSLRPIGELAGHDRATTCMRSVPKVGDSREVLLSCGKDALVKVWDERSCSVALQMHASTAGNSRVLLSCDVSADGLTVAAGTDLQGDDASILYWDPRSPAAPLRAHSYTHSDDITALHFLRSSYANGSGSQNVLLSISTDGLLSTSNAGEPDEDEAGLHVGNWGTSVAQAGWVNGRGGSPGVWASSDMETFSLWTNELDLVQDADIRQPSIHRQDFTWVTDYLIGCHNNTYIPPDRDNDLCIFAGSNEGDVALLTRSTFSDVSAPWKLERLWTTGHAGVVRSSLWDESNNVLLTGGEDSKLNVWTSPGLSSTDHDESGRTKRENDGEMEIDGQEYTLNRKKRRS
ncbi:hypothetical protein PHLCEN_2v12350 [Hermanssonia centrifuga]|uniref:Uncharacterized protein n=1 Tax=Hermanssonia centrifuga TaxID=98765 RepID=A0A2R6NHM0_9APHY|nr:hypothetical protein PHLCEN_2v12350 [Hermanssonia centrifuga]